MTIGAKGVGGVGWFVGVATVKDMQLARRLLLPNALLLAVLTAVAGWAAEIPPTHVVVIGDPHLPGRNLAAKQALIDRINGWDDVALVVVVGDVCESTGTSREYRVVGEFFRRVQKPLVAVTGNHDYVYTAPWKSGRLAKTRERRRKLRRFAAAFGLRALSSDRMLRGYHLVFLSLEGLHGGTYDGIAPRQVQWLNERLDVLPDEPTIVFCHAPLWGFGELDTLVASHPHLFLWVAGHEHLAPTNPAATAPGKVVNVPDIDGRSVFDDSGDLRYHDALWTTSLFLYDDKVVVRVYDHTADRWLDELDRELPVTRRR